jgi:hypothetical protein
MSRVSSNQYFETSILLSKSGDVPLNTSKKTMVYGNVCFKTIGSTRDVETSMLRIMFVVRANTKTSVLKGVSTILYLEISSLLRKSEDMFLGATETQWS